MAKITAFVQSQDGQSGQLDLDAPTLGAARGLAEQQGFRVLGWDQKTAGLLQAPMSVPGAQPHPGPRPDIPFPKSPLIPGAAQIAGPALATALGVTNPLALAGIGIGSALLGARTQGPITGGDVAGAVGTELLPPAAGVGMRALRAARGPVALTRGLAGEAERLGVKLPATTLFGREGTLADRIAQGMVTKGAETEQARAITQNVPTRLRNLFGTLGAPRRAGLDVRSGLNQLRRAIPADQQGKVLEQVRTATGVNLPGLNAKTIVDLTRRNPGALADAAGMLAKAAGTSPDAVHAALSRTFFSDLLDRAVVKAIPGERQFAGALSGGYLDGNVLVKGVTDLAERDKAIFGKARPEVENLVAVLSRAQPAQRAIERLGVTGGAKAGEGFRVSLRPFGMAFALMLGGEAAGELTGFERGTGAERTAEALGAGYLGAKGLATVLSSQAGLRWFAAGVDMANRGIPERIIVPALARALPPVVREIVQGAAPVETGERVAMAPAAPAPLGPAPNRFPGVADTPEQATSAMDVRLGPGWRPGRPPAIQ